MEQINGASQNRRASLPDGSGSFYLNLSQTFDSSFGTQINFTVGGKDVSITTANINTIVRKYAEFVFISYGLSPDEQFDGIFTLDYL